MLQFGRRGALLLKLVVVRFVCFWTCLLSSICARLFPRGGGSARLLAPSSVQLIGHRGASLEQPENTGAAFRRCFAHGVRAIELDVRRTSDGHVVVLHDETLRRTCSDLAAARAAGVDVDAPVSRLPWARVRQVPVGCSAGGGGDDGSGSGTATAATAALRHPEYPMLLSAVLALLPDDGGALVELKGRGDARLVELVVQVAARYAGTAELRFIAFDLAMARGVKAGLLRRQRQVKAYHLGFVVPVVVPLAWQRRTLRAMVDAAAAAGLDGIDVNASPWGAVDAALVGYAHGRGMDVVTWVTPLFREDAFLFDALAAAGVDGYTSNVPPALLAWDAVAREQRGGGAAGRGRGA